MAVQTTYSENMLDNSPGTLAGSDYNTETGICETAGPGGIPFGRVVGQGTLSDQGVILGGVIGKYRGISQKDVTLGAEQDVYLPPDSVCIVNRGSVWVEPSHAVAADDLVYYTAADGKLTNQSSGNLLIKGARWKTSCATNGRALVSLSGYNPDT